MKINTLYNIDCIDGLQRLETDSIDLVLTDIPYDFVNRAFGMRRGMDKGNADILRFDLITFLNEVDRVCRGSFYIFCGPMQLSTLFSFFNDGKHTTRVLVWEKTNPAPFNGKYTWLSGIELCIYAKKPRATFNAFCRNTVIKLPTIQSKLHPTQKPQKLFEELIQISTNEGDTVLDTCIGSGTTALACIATGRNYIGFELDAAYYNIAQSRIT